MPTCGGQTRAVNVFLYFFPSIALRQDVSANRKLPVLARLTGHQALRIGSSMLSYRHKQPCLSFMCMLGI